MRTSISARQRRDSTLWRLRLGRVLPAPFMKKTRPAARVSPVNTRSAPIKRTASIAVGSMPEPGTLGHIAVHESAHAVKLSLSGIEFKHVEIMSGLKGRCHAVVFPTDEVGLEEIIVANLAAGVASNPVDLSYPGYSLVANGAESDYRTASELIDTLLRAHPFTSGQPLLRIGLSPQAIFEERAHNFVRAHQRQIYRVANELLARTKLTAAEVSELCT